MELLLNLIWLALAVGAMAVFVRSRRRPTLLAEVPYRRSLVALACVLVLLFPVISASDDLHPAQAVVEDASKKVQLAIAPLHVQRTNPPLSMLPAMLALFLVSALIVLRPLRPVALTGRALDGMLVPALGRAPPSR
jgi:hypothetical protein